MVGTAEVAALALLVAVVALAGSVLGCLTALVTAPLLLSDAVASLVSGVVAASLDRDADSVGRVRLFLGFLAFDVGFVVAFLLAVGLGVALVPSLVSLPTVAALLVLALAGVLVAALVAPRRGRDWNDGDYGARTVATLAAALAVFGVAVAGWSFAFALLVGEFAAFAPT